MDLPDRQLLDPAPDVVVDSSGDIVLVNRQAEYLNDSHKPERNHLLAALSKTEFARLSSQLKRVEMPLGEVLYESGRQLEYVYFPVTSIVSLLYILQDGCSAEIAGVGNEGILGISAFMGGETTLSRAVVQTAGFGYRLPARQLKEEFNRSGPMMHLLLRYTQALITQMSQTAVCNRHHSVYQQLCRWLLLNFDRSSGDELKITQMLIANMLGVRREGVTKAACKLRNAGIIDYCRGHIKVLDRPRLEQSACECYAVVKKEFDRLLPDIPPLPELSMSLPTEISTIPQLTMTRLSPRTAYSGQ